ncbi:MAG: hypothetical protein ACM31C_18925 [Acidobacteriota bacterium]
MAYVRTPTNPPDTPTHETIYPSQGETTERRVPVETTPDKTTAAVFTGGASLEVIGGAAAVVLAIIGLAGAYPVWMLSIATICAGGALLAEGGSIAARWNDVMRQLGGDTSERAEVVGGIGTEVIGGAAGIVLGILALVGVMPFVLLSVAAIVFGGSLLLGGAAQPELDALVPERDARLRRITRGAIQASGGVMVMVGIAAAVLGILALLSVGPIVTLSLIALLCVGGALLVGGGALTARFARRFT